MSNLRLAIGTPFGLANLILTYHLLFPAGFDLGELSYAEIIFLLSLYAAVSRHWKRGAAVGHSRVHRIFALLAALGIQAALALIMFRVSPSLKVALFGGSSVSATLCWYALVIFGLLVSAPTDPQIAKNASAP